MYVVIELQKMSDTQLANIVTAHNTLQEAESKYHQVLASAAISHVPLHSCVMLNEDAYLVKSESYSHEE